VRIFCGTQAGPTRPLLSAQVEVQEADPVLPRSLLSRAVLGRLLRDEAHRWQPDIVFGTGNFHLPVFAAYHAAGGSPARTVCKLSNPLRLDDPARLMAPAHSLGLRLLTRKIDALVAMSPALREEAQRILRRPGVLTAPEPILDGSSAQLPGNRAEAAGSPLVVCAGRLERQKNFHLALETFAALPPGLGARLAILGEGSQRPSLEKLARRLGIADRVEMPGHVSDVRHWLRQASAFLSTSRYEGYPAVLIEALAARIPVITTDCSPAIREIVEHGTQGDVVPHAVEALSAALLRRLEAPATAGAPDTAADRLQRHRVEWAAGTYLRLLDDIAVTSTPAFADTPDPAPFPCGHPAPA